MNQKTKHLIKEKLSELLARVLGLQPEQITDDISPENTSSWDSFNAVMIVAELEKASGVNFKMADVMAVKNVGGLKQVLLKYHISYEN